jgi:CheY-like chemotaxis protein
MIKMPKILIIEDEISIRRVLINILLEEGDSYIVEEAEDGIIGFEKIKNNDYDLVLAIRNCYEDFKKTISN